MRSSIVAGGTKHVSDSFCRTTLVKKPIRYFILIYAFNLLIYIDIRSKYCTGSGFVVARMDHYCVWLNNCVGYGNHRF